MKNGIKKIALATGLAVLFGVNSVMALDNSARNALLMALDDEYKAFSTYQVVMEKFGQVRPFSNIIRAEENHISVLKELLNKYGVSIPENPYLLAQNRPVAPATLQEACAIGVQAEIENAGLYDDKLMPMVMGHADIQIVFQNLRDASQDRHLPAFERCGQGGGNGGGQGGGHGGGLGKGKGTGNGRGGWQ